LSRATTTAFRLGHQNLRRGLKAEAMQFGLPTQLVWPRTLRVAGTPASGPQRVQDLSTRAWNFCTALYHKVGGAPWRLAELEAGVCFVGISFYKELFEENPRIRSSMAQAFTATGDGYVLRGKAFEWDERQQGRSPHLDKNLAASLLRDVIELYQKQNRGSLPSRIVVHKTSRFWEEEIEGLERLPWARQFAIRVSTPFGLLRDRQKVGDLLVRSNVEPWPDVRDHLNSIIRRWSNYFWLWDNVDGPRARPFQRFGPVELTYPVSYSNPNR
jgi:hypothetical protein